MWRTTPLHRSEEAGDGADLPDEDHDPEDGRQPIEAGVGPRLHRSYAVRIVHSAMSPAALIDLVAANLDRTSPEMARRRALQQAAAGQGDPAEHVVALLRPGRGAGRRPPARRRDDPHAMGPLAPPPSPPPAEHKGSIP